MSLVLGNTITGNQGYVMKCKRYHRYDYSNKFNYFDVDGFSQHSRPNYLCHKQGEKHMKS